jgi:hypothetical protein
METKTVCELLIRLFRTLQATIVLYQNRRATLSLGQVLCVCQGFEGDLMSY